MKPKILVVDDQPGIRLLLTDVFTREGFKVATAKTGLEALKKIDTILFDLIILDYQLPILDGAGVMRQLEQDQQMIPIILMSGLPELLEKESLTYHSIKKIIAKPFNVLEVSELVKSIVS